MNYLCGDVTTGAQTVILVDVVRCVRNAAIPAYGAGHLRKRNVGMNSPLISTRYSLAACIQCRFMSSASSRVGFALAMGAFNMSACRTTAWVSEITPCVVHARADRYLDDQMGVMHAPVVLESAAVV